MMSRSLITSVAFALAATCSYPQSDVQSRDALDVQRARARTVKNRANRVYAHQWNLDSLPRYVPEQSVSGTIRMWGLNYIGDSNLTKYWEDGFRKYQPDIKFAYNLPTALIAIPALCLGAADLGPSRPITFDELLLFQRVFNYDPLEIVMVTGSFDVPGWAPSPAIAVHRDNPISRLTLKQLDGIFGAARSGGYQGTTWHPEVARSSSENIRTWGQLGLTGDWKDRRIHVYGVNLRFHVARLIERVVFKGGDKWNEDLSEYTNFAKPDGSLGRSRELFMADLSKDPYGIAITYMSDLTPQTKVLALAAEAGGPYVEPTIENLQSRIYPLLGEEYWYLNRRPGQPLDPKLKEFLTYTLSREGQEAVGRDGKFLPLTAEVVRAQLKKLE
jgi:phosphate transport system substrate-binding protein